MANPSIWDLLVLIEAGSPNALGQATSANSVPVVIASDQSAIPISGTVSIGSGPFAVTQSGTWNITDISGTVSLPTGASTASNQTSGGQKTQITDSSGTASTLKTLGTQVVSTDVGLVVNSVIHGLTTAGGGSYVDVKVTPSGALSTALGDISGIVGQQLMASSIPVAIASNQSAVPASQSGTWNITNISGTVSLPTGAATESTLSTLNGKFGTLGQKTMAGSAPVVLASDQASIPVAATQSGTWNITNISGTVSLPTGAATETTLSAINTKLVTQALAFGNPSAGLRVAAVIGNASAVADFNAGTVGTTTLGMVRRAGSTATLTNVSTSTASATLLSANTSRLSATIFNDSTGTLIVKYGTTASGTSLTAKIPPGRSAYIEGGEYNGRIDGILDAGTGTARCTEITP